MTISMVIPQRVMTLTVPARNILMRDRDYDTSTIVLSQQAMSSIDDFSWAFDVSLNLIEGETVSDASAALFVETSEVEFPDGLPDPVDAGDTIISQRVAGLTKGVDYRLQIGYTTSLGKTLSFALPIPCVF